MEVICISSDSENSNQLDETIVYSKPLNLEEDVFLMDWNNDYDFPAVDNIEPPKTDDVILSPKRLITEEVNENLVTTPKDKFSTSRYEISESSSSDDCDKELTPTTSNNKVSDYTRQFSLKKPQNKMSQEQRESTKVLREQKKLERGKMRERKKAERERQKASKAVFVENQRNLKPEENIKFLKVHIDTEIINSDAGGNLIVLLQQNNIQYGVESQVKGNTIFWSKKRTIKELDEDGNIIENSEYKEEEELIYVINWNLALKLIHTHEFLSHAETVKSVYPGKKLTVVIYGLQKYFDFFKNKKKNEGKTKKYTETESAFNDAPKITYDQLEFALTDLQLFGNHNVRLIESPVELSALILHFTKSLSQLDYKLDKQKRQEDDFDWFAKGDSSQAVKVDKNGAGLIKLWQQQICQFNAVGLETAQAIVSQYGSPLSLVTKYGECATAAEGELLLQNLQIRRDFGLLSSTRKVGPQLSKKIYRFFTSDDPDEEL